MIKNAMFKKCESAQSSLEIAQRKLSSAVREMLPIGSVAFVKRGKGVWKVEVVGHYDGRFAGEFNGKSKTGKIHSFHFGQCIEVVTTVYTYD